MVNLAWDHWHIEPSSICSLKCPRCPRAEVADSLLNRQLDLRFFREQIGAEVIKNIRKITFCGNDGDPIYCKQLTDIIGWIKAVKPDLQITLITNGSHKSTQFWSDLAHVMNEHDEIHWSLDGWDQVSNQRYRINCDWKSITAGIDTFFQCNSSTYRVWAAIAFRFNERRIEAMKNLAQTRGFDLFQLTKSTKFGSKYPDSYSPQDPLEPENPLLVASGHRFEREAVVLSEKSRPGAELKQIFLQRAQDLDKHKQYSGICLIGNKGVFLNSRGEFYPCCWVANRYEHNQLWHELAQSRFNLHHRPFLDIINDSYWTKEFLAFDQFECQTKCGPERLSDLEHTTEW